MIGRSTTAGPSASACKCQVAATRRARTIRWSSGAGLLAALGACGACCLLPTALLALGAGSSWVARLASLEPFQGWLATLAAVLLAAGFHAAYRRRTASCGPEFDCAPPAPSRWLLAALWIAAALAALGIGAEWLLRLE